MDIELLLRDLVAHVDGAVGSIFLDQDGEAVHWYAAASAGDRLKLRAAYLAVLVRACRIAASRLDSGRITNMILTYEGAHFVIEEIKEGYFLALELGPAANLAQALSHIQPAVTELAQEISA